MTFKSSAMFAWRLIFPRTGKKSSARRSIAGAILCIGISIIPLVVVMSFADGMIGGMTQRIIGLSTCELKARVRVGGKESRSYDALKDFARKLAEVDGVMDTYPHLSCDALAAGKTYRTGANIRAVEPDIFTRNPDYKDLFKLCSGNYDDFIKNKRSAVLGEKIAEERKNNDYVKVNTLSCHQKAINTIAKISDDKIVSGGSDCRVIVWKMNEFGQY